MILGTIWKHASYQEQVLASPNSGLIDKGEATLITQSSPDPKRTNAINGMKAIMINLRHVWPAEKSWYTGRDNS